MRNSIMIMTGMMRVFDGYDRWEKYRIQEFGSKEELEALKVTFENPIYSNKKYTDLAIREATEQEIAHYKRQLEDHIRRNEKEYEEVLKKKKELATLIQESKEKVKQLNAFKIPH